VLEKYASRARGLAARKTTCDVLGQVFRIRISAEGINAHHISQRGARLASQTSGSRFHHARKSRIRIVTLTLFSFLVDSIIKHSVVFLLNVKILILEYKR